MQYPEIPRRFLRSREVAEIFGVHRVTIWRWVRAGTFPAPYLVDGNTQRWRGEDLRAWCVGKYTPAPSRD